LDRPTETESADIRLKVAQADHIYMSDRAVLPEEIAVSRFAGPQYSIETQLNPGPREELEFPQDTAAADLAAAKPAPVVAPGGAKPGKVVKKDAPDPLPALQLLAARADREDAIAEAVRLFDLTELQARFALNQLVPK
jgi:hypothetical protein